MANFKLDVDATALRSSPGTWPGRSMNVIDHRRRSRSSARSSTRSAADAAIKGVVDHLRQGRVLRRRRPHHAREHARALYADMVTQAGRGSGRQHACSTKAASSRSSIGASRPAASPGSRRSTAPRSAAASSSRSPATTASPSDNRQDAARPARNQDRPVSRRRRHPARRAHDAARPTRCSSCSRAIS